MDTGCGVLKLLKWLNVQVPGFGYVDNFRISDRLQFAAFPVVSPDECIKSLKRIPPLSTFCAGYKNGKYIF